ncbi:MAG TPA: chromosome segregation protein SMC [Stellaceae bacterium]|jgi:chromosome segregation protein|nr:chromosome segregation protein SMC [Stellaceae bacterium]
MHIERLRLVGFKSFVDATELVIEPGLTGIVGPNGCGKSNLVDALRWIMGEGSARRLRGGGMDDVIFAGSSGRPARNTAEVVLTIDNSARAAPFAFNDRETIEIGRRIERGGGSAYRINGREVRARDVQLLFADAATGAHSEALVSQGRIGALISAKPIERRLLLDEAAGTAGLHARRHEAELKLKAAEANLLRVDDVLTAMSTQLDGLKKQARAAQRYRRLAEQIRRTEAMLLAARWRLAVTEAERISAELNLAETEVSAAAGRAREAEQARAAAEAGLPALRQAEAAAAAEVQRLAQRRAVLDQELARLAEMQAEAERRLGQFGADLAREDENLADAETALARLADERHGLERGAGAEETARAEAEKRLAEAAADLAGAETGLQQMTEACASGDARRGALERQRRDLSERRGRLENRRADSERQRAAITERLDPSDAASEAARALAEAEADVEARRAAATASVQMLTAAQAGEVAALDRARSARHELDRLRAEAEALASILEPGPAEGGASEPPVMAQLDVPEGLEAATAAAFNGELAAPALPRERVDEGTSCLWIALGPVSESYQLPADALPLAGRISVPAVLDRRLQQIGLVDSEATGWQLQPQLRPGQSLVDRDGRLWRWDGFVRLSAAAGSTAQQLRQRRRLAELTAAIAAAADAADRAGASATAARTAREQAAAGDQEARQALRQAEERLARNRAIAAEIAARAANAQTRLAALAETITELTAELDEAAKETAEAERALSLLPDPGLARAGLEAARTQAAAARRREAEARGALDRLAQEAAARRRRLDTIGEEEQSWQRRRAGATAQQATLNERRRALAAEIADMRQRPDAIAAERDAFDRTAAEAQQVHRAAAASLESGEARLRGAGEAARQSEHEVAEHRERRARREAQRDAAAETLARLREEIGERLDTAPEALSELAEAAAADEPTADTAALAARLERLVRERDNIGPVNLVAEAEAAEIETQIEELQAERADLTEAIARLRRGIGALDREGRERLLAAFEKLNGHFTDLFGRLFGGGKAHLALEESDDPLEAGLEIMASPPGKRLQSLSLLSGGEQALTAIALIFAVFLTNPAPVCVLDEVDAPLDDANIERFCSLVAEIADATGTRFLLVTHHRITMARMDRLFGVTMPERGVSQLVSVDLARAAEMRQTA